MAAEAAPAALAEASSAAPTVQAPAAKIAGPLPPLDSFSAGLLGTKFKKGDTWDESPTGWVEGAASIDKARQLQGKIAPYMDISYTNYDLDSLKEDDFPQTTIPTIADKYKIKKGARIYAKTAPELDTRKIEFQKAVDAQRTAQLTPLLAKKKGDEQAAWNELTKEVDAKTQAELASMKDAYLKKKSELEKQLEAAYKAQTKQLVINKQHNKYSGYQIPGTKQPKDPRGNASDQTLIGSMDSIGRPIINSIKIPSTRKKHRFRDLLSMPLKTGLAIRTPSQTTDAPPSPDVPPSPEAPQTPDTSQTPDAALPQPVITQSAGSKKRNTKRKPRRR